MAACPECGEALVRGTFCRGCGYDADLSSDDDEAHLEGLDLPEGYGRKDPDDEQEYEQTYGVVGRARSMTFQLIGILMVLGLAALVLTQAMRR